MIPETLSWETALQKPPYPARLIQASVFYQNDQMTNCFAVDIHGIEERDLHDVFDLSRKIWESSPAEHERMLDSHMREIEDFARRTLSEKQNADPRWATILLIDMIWLVWMGRVKNDEYNGTLFVWESGVEM